MFLTVVCLYHSTHGHILILQAAIVQIDLLTSIGNPSPITTCIKFFYSKLSYSLLPSPSVCILAHQDSCSLHIATFPASPHMHEEPEMRLVYKLMAAATFFLIKVTTIQTSLILQ